MTTHASEISQTTRSPAASYALDASHSEIGFSVRHMVFAKVRGQFKEWAADVSYDAADPLRSSVTVEIDTASIDTREPQRDTHLRSADFFDSEAHPKMTFSSKRLTQKGERSYELVGDLTIRGVTREITLAVEQTGAGKDPWANARLGFAAKTTIRRGDWGLRWNQALEAGGLLVSDEVDIDVEVQLVEKT
jgi:polyisoprenoid-binding protein YceI